MSRDLQDLTIGIFSKNREPQLTSKVIFWEKLGLNLVILDASREPLTKLLGEKTTYHHLPEMPLDARFLMFSTLVKTEFFLLSPDDDYFFPSGLRQVVTFLKNNPDYASAQGLRIRLINTPKFRWIPDYTKQLDLDFSESDKVQRLLHMSTSMHFIYSVMRLETFTQVVNCLENTQNSPRNSDAKNELVFNYVLPILGKHRILPVLYSARTHHNYEGKDINFGDWINDSREKTAVEFRGNIHKIYSVFLNCTQELAQSYEGVLTQNFSRESRSGNSRANKQRTIFSCARRLINSTVFRFLYPLSKKSYLRFFYALYKNRTFYFFLVELFNLLHFRLEIIKMEQDSKSGVTF